MKMREVRSFFCGNGQSLPAIVGLFLKRLEKIGEEISQM